MQTQSQNLLALYRRFIGKSEVPVAYHIWSCLATMAALVQDRVWIEKLRDEKLFAHLFVFLIGDSGSGKGTAISKAMRLAKAAVPQDCNFWTYRGRLTAPGLIDLLAKGQPQDKETFDESIIRNPRLFLICDELANAVRKGRDSEEVFKFLTEIYTGYYDFQDTTRTSGNKRIENACVTWLAGSAQDWLADTMTLEIAKSGFTARTVFVEPEMDYSVRYYREQLPPDYEELKQQIITRFLALNIVRGEFKLTSAARNLERVWYESRQVPTDDLLIPAWKREQDILLKLSMLVSLADGGPLLIQDYHMITAMRLVDEVRSKVPRVVEIVARTNETKPVEIVRQAIKRKGVVAHTPLLRLLYRRGITAKTMRAATHHLLQEGVIQVRQSSVTKRLEYLWLK